MILVDTSVWIDVLRDKTGETVDAFRKSIKKDDIVFCRFTQLELLQGVRDDREWQQLDKYLSTQYYLEASDDTWRHAAKIYFDLRRNGVTLSSPIDCCIAQLAIEAQTVLLHCDQDFERIAAIRPLSDIRFELW